MTKSAKSTTTVATEHCVQWNNACSVDQSILDETNVICYLRSLEWPVNENVVFDRGIIIKDCNDLMTLFGRKVVTRRSDGTLIQLVCKHANEYRPAKGTKTADSKIISQPINPCQQSFVEDADMSTSQSINPLVTEPLYPSSIEPAQVQQPQVTGSGEPSQTSNDQTKPAPKARLTTTEQFDLAQMYGVEVNHEARNLTLNHMQCSCSFFNQYGLMCRHLMASWLLDTCKSSPADQTSQNQATALTIKSLLTDELNHQLADVCINATPQRWTHAAAYRVFDEKHAPVEARTHTITHHQFSNSPSVPHVPESNFMQQLEIDHWLERIRRASQQHEVAAQITIMELSETHSRIEQRCAAQTSSTSNTSSLNSRLSVNFSSQLETTEPTVSMPKDAADPVNARHKRVLSTLSTKESGKQLAKRQKAAVSP